MNILAKLPFSERQRMDRRRQGLYRRMVSDYGYEQRLFHKEYGEYDEILDEESGEINSTENLEAMRRWDVQNQTDDDLHKFGF